MSYEIRADYQQSWLFPPNLDDLLPADHPARLIRDLVDAMDLEELGFAQRTSIAGRPNYAADLLLKVWLYGYLSGVRRLRRLERACRENLALIWLTGMNYPDHNSLWRFWRDHRAALRRVYRRSLEFAIRKGLVSVVLHAVDGTKIAAHGSKETVRGHQELQEWLAQLDESVEQVMAEVETAAAQDMEEAGGGLPAGWEQEVVRREQVRELIEEMEERERQQIHLLERDARMMKTRDSGVVPGYNAQAVVDGHSGLIVAQDVVTEESDNHQLIPMLEEVKETLGQTAAVTVADGGYHAAREIAQAQQRGYGVLINESQRQVPGADVADTEFHSSRFRYDPERDVCVCPRGEELRLRRERHARAGREALRVYHCTTYQTCPVRWQCSKAKGGRTIEIGIHHAAVMRQREKQRWPENKALLRRRKEIVEAPFGFIKEVLGLRRFRAPGLENVRTEWALACTVFNLCKLRPIWRTGGLVFAH
jgi:transposase